MTDFCFYKALTIHQLIQFRTSALPYYADRHSLTVLSGGIRLAALNSLQDYSLHSSTVAKESPPQSCHCCCCCHSCCWLWASNSASCLSRVLQALLPWQPGEDRSHKCTSLVHWEWPRKNCCLLPLRLSRSGSVDTETLVSAQWVATVQCSTCRNWNAHPE